MPHFIKKVMLLLFLIGSYNAIAQGVFNSTAAGGNFNTVAAWTLISGTDIDGIPDSDDDVNILATHNINLNANCACNNISITGTLNFNSTNTLSAGGNLTTNGGCTVGGGTTANLNVAGNLTVAAGVSTFTRGNITITGTTTVNGTIRLATSTTGTKTFTGNATFNNGSAIDYGVSETLDFLGSITTNGTVTISGATTGLLNIGTTLTVSAASTLNMSDCSLTVTGATSINGAIVYGNNQGTKDFASITIAVGGNWNCSGADETFIIRGNLTNSGTFQASNSTAAGAEYNFNTAGSQLTGTMSMPNVNISGAGTVTNNGTLTVTTRLFGGGSYTQAAGSTLNIGATAGNFTVTTFNATANNNTVDYNLAGAQTVRGTSYFHLNISNSGTKTQGNNIIVLGNLTIQNTAALDASGTNYDITLAGNWTVTSTAADPYVEQTSIVTFNGSAGVQAITTPLAGGETFASLVFNNTSVANPSITTNKNINVSRTYTHTLGKLNLLGNSLIITGAATATTDNFSAGTIFSTVGGSAITITDPSDNKRVNFYGTAIGTSTQGITVTCTSNDSYFTGTRLYGTATFTKTGTGNNDTQGGNVFYGPVTFQTTAGADRWRMANAQPDTFYNATFTHNGNNNFIVSRQTLGNAYYGTTTFTSTSTGGMFISRGNTSADASSDFFGPVIFNITLTGNITVCEGGAGRFNNATFHNTITLNSTVSSTGDYNFGGSNNFGFVTLANSGAFNGGSINGQTNVYLRNVTQTGNAANIINTTGSTGILYVGGNTGLTSNYPCTFIGNCTFSSDTGAYIVSGTFGGNLTFTVANGNGYIHTTTIAGNLTQSAFAPRIRNSSITGTTTFTQTGSTNNDSNGGNTFGGNATVTVSGTGRLRFASTANDDYNANATFVQTNTGVLTPVYSNDVTFAGNISTVGSTSVITFGSTGTATAITDGTGTQIIDGPGAFIPLFTRLRTNHTGIVQTNKSINVTTVLTMTQGSVNLNGNTLTLGTAVGSAGTLTYTAGFFYGGTFTRWFATANLAMLNARGHFPMGTNQNHYRPLWLAYTANLTTGGTVSVTHNPTYPAWHNLITPYNDASWGNNVVAVSNSNWTIATGNGFAINGATGQLRFGGQGFDIFVLTDINASLLTTTVGTYAASTNANVPLEVNRTALTNGNVNNTWTIGTRNIVTSPLPVTWLNVSAMLDNGITNISWQTATETNNDYFTVERSSDGEKFQILTTVNGSGNSNYVHSYSSIDDSPLKGVSYYRIKQTDFNGQSSYSQIVSINNNIQENSFIIYPNPNNGANINIKFNNTIESDFIVNIYNSLGEKAYSALYNNSFGGIDYFSFNPGIQFSKGNYIITIETNGKILYKKLIIQ